jgi:phosphoglycolate phosphatase
MRYTTIVFDLDGTLVDSYAALAEAINFARKELGREPLELDRVKSFVGEGLEVFLQRSFHPDAVPSEAGPVFERKYDEICCNASKLLDGVMDTVKRLHEAGAQMAICTNKPTAFSVKIVEHVGLGEYIGAVIGPDLAGARKPSGLHVLHAIRAIDGDVASTLFVGDMVIDVEAARNAGTAIAVIPTGVTSVEDLRAAGADYVLERFEDLLAVVGVKSA